MNFFGYWRRLHACKMAAIAIQGQGLEGVLPRLWSLTVFFETYLHSGAAGTVENFGPKEPVELKPAQEVQ